MASNIKFKRSAVQNRVPTTAQLDLGELALNTYDGKLYTEINTGSAAVIEIGSKLSSLVVDGDNGGGGGDVTFHGTTAGADLTWDFSDNSLKFADNTKAKFGTGGDLEIFHNGTNSYIDNNQGDLVIGSSGTLRLVNVNNTESFIKCITNSAVEIYHDNSKKFETTAYGTNTTGTAVNDGLVVAGVATVTTMNVTGVLTYDDVTSVDSVGIVTARQGFRATGGTTVLGANSTGFTPHTSSWATNNALTLVGNYGGGLAFSDNGNNLSLIHI